MATDLTAAYWEQNPDALLVLSPQGVVRAKLAEEDYKVRPTNEAVMAAVDGLKKR